MTLMVIFAEPAAEQDTGRPPLPTLGEIVDKLAEERPEMVLEFDPTWQNRRVAKVQVMTKRETRHGLPGGLYLPGTM